MKNKVIIALIFVFSLLFVGNVYAENSVHIESVTLDSKSETITLAEAKYEGLSVNLDVKFGYVNEFAKFKIVINNPTNKKYELNLDGNNSGEYLTYSYEYDSNIINPKEIKTIFVTITYKSEVPEDAATNEVFNVGDIVYGVYSYILPVGIELLVPYKAMITNIEETNRVLYNINNDNITCIDVDMKVLACGQKEFDYNTARFSSSFQVYFYAGRGMEIHRSCIPVASVWNDVYEIGLNGKEMIYHDKERVMPLVKYYRENANETYASLVNNLQSSYKLINEEDYSQLYEIKR